MLLWERPVPSSHTLSHPGTLRRYRKKSSAVLSGVCAAHASNLGRALAGCCPPSSLLLGSAYSQHCWQLHSSVEWQVESSHGFEGLHSCALVVQGVSLDLPGAALSVVTCWFLALAEALLEGKAGFTPEK